MMKNINPYRMSNKNKNYLFKKQINELTNFHASKCKEYNKIIKFLGFNKKKKYSLESLPYLPVQIFKEVDLLSTQRSKIVKVINSSGTSSGKPSKIFLDKKNSSDQINALKKIIQFHIGNERLPMIIIDKKSSIHNSGSFDAKKAAFFGFAIFAKDFFFLLNENGTINYEGLNKFLKKNKSKFLIFGFTYQVFDCLFNKLNKKKLKKDFKHSILLHGGGWKKMENMKISNKDFKNLLFKKLKIKNFLNYYGLTEQTGSIFLECKCGYFVTSEFSDIIIRDEELNLINKPLKGLIQLMSLLPTSYPGHNILTQDIGEIVDKNKCSCKLNGKRFLVHGRAQKAELRGCSDTAVE